MARPTTYTVEMADLICQHIAEGKGLVKALEAIGEGAPSYTAVNQWLRAQPEFAQSYARAREDQADWHADRIAEIGDSTLVGTYEHQAAKVAIDALKWSASKLRPRKYGDKLAIGGDPDAPPIKTKSYHQIDLKGLTLEELDVLDSVMKKAGGLLPREIEEQEEGMDSGD